jgi:outer membrane protein
MAYTTRTNARCHRPGTVALVVACLLPPAVSNADWFDGKIGRYLDSIDFNDYALALSVYRSEAVYDGAPDSSILYPMLASFDHATTTTNSLFVRDANLGLRRVLDTGWSYGAFATVQTDGYSAIDNAALAGMEDRSWTLAGGLVGGRKLGPIHADLFVSTDLLGEHHGQEFNLKFAWPLTWQRVQLVPQVEIHAYSADYINYYYGVRNEEATATRPAYEPGSASTYAASIQSSWRLGPNWFLRAHAGIEFLPEEISDSPLVVEDSSWYVNLAVAYNAAAFIDPGSATERSYGMTLDTSIEAFFLNASTLVDLDSTDASAAVALESNSNLDDRVITYPVELTLRIGRYHSVSARYFELFRDAQSELNESRTVRDTRFEAGEILTTGLNTRVLRLDYGFAFFRDPQKEFSIFGGLHSTRFDYDASGDNQQVSASTTAVLPLIGARLRANPRERLSVLANLEIFLMDFNLYSGHLLDLSAAVQYRIGDSLHFGGGYRYYRQKLDSGDESFRGTLRIDYRGPYLSLRYIF